MTTAMMVTVSECVPMYTLATLASTPFTKVSTVPGPGRLGDGEGAPEDGTAAVSFTPTIPSSSAPKAPATRESASITIREPTEQRDTQGRTSITALQQRAHRSGLRHSQVLAVW